MILTSNQIDFLYGLVTNFGYGKLDTEITIEERDGHSGKGLYAWYTEHPEEGAFLLEEKGEF